MMKKKIMHISQSNGGVARYLQMLFKYMNKEKYEQILVYANEYISENDLFKGLVDKIEFINMYREINLKNDIKAIIELYKVIKKYNPDLIYIHSSKAGALGRIVNIVTRKPIIYNPHGWSFNMDISNKKKYVYKLIEKVLATQCDKIIAISNQEKISAINNRICNDEKIQVIYNGIDVEEYTKSIVNKNKYKKKYNIPENAVVIGMVGRISKQKSPDIFIKAASEIKKKVPNAFFIIVGDGDERKKIENLISLLDLNNCVLITGWVQNSYQYIQFFDVAMLLSRWEGFGLAIAEYMISGVPVIATNVDAIPNLITNNETGVLVEVDNIEQIVNSVIKILSNKRFSTYIVQNARYKVKKDFNVVRVALEHENMIDELIDGHYKVEKILREEDIQLDKDEIKRFIADDRDTKSEIKNMNKIVVFNALQTSLNGGIGRYSYELAKELYISNPQNVKIVIRKEDSDLFDFAKNDDLIILANIKNSKIRNIYEQFELPKLIYRKFPNAIIHYPDSMAPLFAKNNVVITIHDLAFKSLKNIFTWKTVLWKNLITNISIKKADKIIAITNFTKNEILRYYPNIDRNKISVVYNGFNDFSKDKINQENISYKIKNINKDYILTVSTISPRKNIDGLIKAFNNIKDNINEKLIIAGNKGWLCEEIYNLVNDLKLNDRVIFTGKINDDELKYLYKNAKLFVYVSFYEGFGLPPLEAMSYGIPCVVSNTTSIPEVVGDGAIYVNPKNIDEISNYIIRGINGENINIVAKGKANIKKFSWKKCANDVRKIYGS